MRRRNWDEKGEMRFRLILLAVMLLLLASIHLIAPDFYPTILRLTRDRDLDGLIIYLQGFGIWAVFVSFSSMWSSISWDSCRPFSFLPQTG